MLTQSLSIRIVATVAAILTLAASLPAADAPPITAADIDTLIAETLAPPNSTPAAPQPVADQLNRHVEQMIAAGHLMPLVVVTGKTKIYAFDHPRELFQCLSVALPCLTPETRAKAIAYLKTEYEKTPPFDANHYKLTGTPRCPGGNYDSITPDGLTINQSERPDFGMYAMWAFCHYTDQKDLATRDWPRIAESLGWAEQRAAKLMKATPSAKFAAELGRKVGPDETRRADGHALVELDALINNLVGIARLALMTNHPQEAAKARDLLLPLVQDRAKFPQGVGTSLRGWEPVLWYEMTPELMRLIARAQGDAIKSYMDSPATEDLKFNSRFARNNFWHLAWAEGCMTDECAITYPQIPRALYALRAFLYQDGPEELARLADMPWCTGDLYWIEKLTYTLWASSGRNWAKVVP